MKEGMFNQNNVKGFIRMSKRTWSNEEDELIKDLVSKGLSWSNISSHFPTRSGKQCRERYKNHLRTDIKKGGWTEAEDDLIMAMNEKYGNSWVKIKKFLPGRTDNAIKNRYHAILRARNAKETCGLGTCTQKYVGSHHELSTDSTDSECWSTNSSTSSINELDEKNAYRGINSPSLLLSDDLCRMLTKCASFEETTYEQAINTTKTVNSTIAHELEQFEVLCGAVYSEPTGIGVDSLASAFEVDNDWFSDIPMVDEMLEDTQCSVIPEPIKVTKAAVDTKTNRETEVSIVLHSDGNAHNSVERPTTPSVVALKVSSNNLSIDVASVNKECDCEAGPNASRKDAIVVDTPVSVHQVDSLSMFSLSGELVTPLSYNMGLYPPSKNGKLLRHFSESDIENLEIADRRKDVTVSSSVEHVEWNPEQVCFSQIINNDFEPSIDFEMLPVSGTFGCEPVGLHKRRRYSY